MAFGSVLWLSIMQHWVHIMYALGSRISLLQFRHFTVGPGSLSRAARSGIFMRAMILKDAHTTPLDLCRETFSGQTCKPRLCLPKSLLLMSACPGAPNVGTVSRSDLSCIKTDLPRPIMYVQSHEFALALRVTLLLSFSRRLR